MLPLMIFCNETRYYVRVSFRTEYMIKLLTNQRWAKTEQLVNGIVKLLADFRIKSDILLDLYCGNGRTCIYMAKKGFRTVGVDTSKTFLDDDSRDPNKNH
jgi:tRNA/tmRNA/rRNA uracil-C5-methylase (TrmA/RlmC/RlmD family)